MLEYFLTVGQQIFSMFLMVLAGYFSYRKGFIGEKGLSDMSQLLLKLVTPMVLLSSFQRSFSPSLFKSWILMFGITLLTYHIFILLATFSFWKKSHPLCPENRLSIVFPNNGFMAIPLMLALAEETGVFLGSTNIIFLNILFWTYGSKTLDPKAPRKIKQIFLNPGSISVALGLLLFLSPWKLPKPVFQAMSAIGSLNTPLAMLVLGGFLAQTDLSQILKTKAFYKISIIKLLVAPCLIFFVLSFLPLPDPIKIVSSICSVTPTATALSMLTDIYQRDFRYASGAVMVTTMFSLITIPIMMTLGKIILGF